jgi:hypothetical protein
MLRIAVLAGTAVLAIGTACPICAQTVYQCVPDEPRAAAPDRLVSVEITLKPNGEFASVVYRAANGAAYDRSKQYETENRQDKSGKHYWIGTLLVNRNVAMVGSFYRLGNRLIYIETVHDKLQRGKLARFSGQIDMRRPADRSRSSLAAGTRRAIAFCLLSQGRNHVAGFNTSSNRG